MKTPRYSFDEENHDELTGDPEGEWCLARDVRKLEAELLALREKYSTPCEDCEGFHASEITSCPKCHGTRRVMMLDAEGVKAESIEKDDDDEIDDGWKGAMKRVLKGEGGKK
jgi:DnaJ-class molecular chaperone